MAQILDETLVRQALDPRRVIAALETAFGDQYRTFAMPVRLQMELPSRGVLLLMPCSRVNSAVAGVKLVLVLDNPPAESGTVQATYVLLSATTGKPELVMPANWLTDTRTAATSSLATKHLARPDACTLGVFGTGRQAWAHIAVLPLVRRFNRVLVCGSSMDSSSEFARKAELKLGMKVEAVDADTCAAQSDVLCTCTSATAPLFDGRRLRTGAHVNAIGAFRPSDREVDDETVRRARVVVDTYEGALEEAGDLLIPIRSGAISRSHIVADLHELLRGSKQVRRNSREITLFKSLGCALEDLVAAELIREELAASAIDGLTAD